MRVPLLAMTVLGIALIGYGFYNLLQKNPEFRAEIMKHLTPEQQVQVNNLLNTAFDIGRRSAKIDAPDPRATCTGPSQTMGCKSPGGNPLPNQQMPPPQEKKEFDPSKATAADTFNELKNIKEQRKAEQKVLDDIMEQ